MNEWLDYHNNVYRTTPKHPGWVRRTFPTPCFYRQFLANVVRSSGIAKRGRYDSETWSRTSYEVLRSLESVGVKIEVTGTEHLRSLNTPCVFIGNHMSMLETIILPSIIQPIMDVTFVVKASLVDYPVFKHILRSRNPIAVSRTNPREDFKTVIAEGTARLRDGVSVVVFPQTTRCDSFSPEQFNTIGVKLAARANVPVVPIALQTDAWGNGRWIKDFGPIDRKKPVRFAFGPPITVQGRGQTQHRQVIDFIQSQIRSQATTH